MTSHDPSSGSEPSVSTPELSIPGYSPPVVITIDPSNVWMVAGSMKRVRVRCRRSDHADLTDLQHRSQLDVETTDTLLEHVEVILGAEGAGFAISGTRAGTTLIRVRVLDQHVFVPVTVLPSVVRRLVKLSGDDQLGVVGHLWPNAISVRALDRYGNAVAGARISLVEPAARGETTAAHNESETDESGVTSWRPRVRCEGVNRLYARIVSPPLVLADTVVFTGLVGKAGY